MSEYYLSHHGIEGQKWGVRRFQNEDGSLTPEGRKRYNKKDEYDEAISEYNKATRKMAKIMSKDYGRRAYNNELLLKNNIYEYKYAENNNEFYKSKVKEYDTNTLSDDKTRSNLQRQYDKLERKAYEAYRFLVNAKDIPVKQLEPDTIGTYVSQNKLNEATAYMTLVSYSTLKRGNKVDGEYFNSYELINNISPRIIGSRRIELNKQMDENGTIQNKLTDKRIEYNRMIRNHQNEGNKT